MSSLLKNRSNYSVTWLSLIFFLFFWFNVCSAAKAGQAKPNSITYDKPECNENYDKIDSLVVKALGIGKGGRSFPTNQAEARKFCKDTETMLNQGLQFLDKCLAEETRRLGKIYFYSARNSLKPICGKKKTKKYRTFLEAGSCLNTFVPKDKCLEQFVNDTLALVPYKLGSDKFKYMCCLFVDVMKCAEQTLTIPCMTAAGRDVMLELVRAIGADVSNVACGEYNESTDRCDSLPPLPKSKFDKSVKIYPAKSFAFAQLQVLESMNPDNLDSKKQGN